MQCMILPAQLADYSHYEVWDEITYPVPNFNGATIDIWEWIGNFIPHFAGHMFSYPCWDDTKSMLMKWSPAVCMYEFVDSTALT